VQVRELVAAFQVELLEEIESGPFVRLCGGGQAEAAEGSYESSAMHCSRIQDAGGMRQEAGGRKQDAEGRRQKAESKAGGRKQKAATCNQQPATCNQPPVTSHVLQVC
jgi:hypothetical protein